MPKPEKAPVIPAGRSPRRSPGHSLATTPDPLARIPVADGKKAVGRPAMGAYPNVSRKGLAEALGLHVSTVSFILCGRTEAKMHDALGIARELGISVESLMEELAGAREDWKFMREQKAEKSKSSRNGKKRVA